MGKRGKGPLRAVALAVTAISMTLVPSLGLAAFTALGAALQATPAGASTAPTAPTPPTPPTAVEYYLDLGGSASVGFQPTAIRPDGQPTDTGYANDLLSSERARWHGLQLVQFGCPGETTWSFMGGGDRCRPAGQTQMAEAVAFLRAHPDTVLVTIDLGFNDIDRCLAFHTVNEACLAARLDLIDEQLPAILVRQRAAAGPSVRFVGVGHYDPYLGDYLHGGPAVDFAQDSVAAIAWLDETLHDIYSDAGVPMANVGQAFEMTHSEPVDLAGVGDVPTNVQRTCVLTWMCTSASPRAKQHPNNAGYQVIAQAIAAAVPG